MDAETLLGRKAGIGALIALLLFLAILVGAETLAWLAQRGFGRTIVSNVTFENFNGLPVRAKLLRPVQAGADRPLPGVVYIHGYQNNRETADAYCLELARRGFVVLNIDAIGRGNSGLPGDPADPDFDPTYGGRSSLEFLRKLPLVRTEDVGLMGHSLGAETAYRLALEDPYVQALVISGFAYTEEASPSRPKNMLMIIGRWDEYRQRMTGVRDIERDWLATERGRGVFEVDRPELGRTYGDFETGRARRVVVPAATHIQVSHHEGSIAEALVWMKKALNPPEELWIDPEDQVWPIKEWSTLAAMPAGLALVCPLALLLLRTRFFRPLFGPPKGSYVCPWKSWFKHASINAVFMWLYLPLILTVFAVHIYLVRIDQAFPMMLLNAILWWFFWINVFGLFVFRRWYRKARREGGPGLDELGLSWAADRLKFDGGLVGRTALLALILFGVVYGLEHLLEAVFIVDWRFIFPFASDLTPARAWLGLRYFPFFLFGFIQTGAFLHGQLKRPAGRNWFRTFLSWSATNILALVGPLVLFLAVQYVPLFTTGLIPFQGPGGMFVSMIINIFHIIGILIMVVPISTWCFQLTGKVYLGAAVNALLVTWMMVSSQVVAPIPV